MYWQSFSKFPNTHQSNLIILQGTYVEGIKEELVLSPGHALSFIAAGEGILLNFHF